MRTEDLERLARIYPNDNTEPDRRFNIAVGSSVPSAPKLIAALLSDFTDNFGVSWWTTLPTEERMLIGDYFCQCLMGIETNLVEARLHYLELRGLRTDRTNEYKMRWH